MAGLSGAVTKFDANVAAIRVLQVLEAGQRARTPKSAVNCCASPAGAACPPPSTSKATIHGVAPSRRGAAELLPAEDYDSARASVNNSHYTEVHVIEAIWQAVARFGFTGGRVLEPAAGVGHFRCHA